MCGNFGLLSLGQQLIGPAPSPHPEPTKETFEQISSPARTKKEKKKKSNEMDISRRLLSSVAATAYKTAEVEPKKPKKALTNNQNGVPALVSPLLVLEGQTASTEVRGGQSGGYSTIEFNGNYRNEPSPKSHNIRVVALPANVLRWQPIWRPCTSETAAGTPAPHPS